MEMDVFWSIIFCNAPQRCTRGDSDDIEIEGPDESQDIYLINVGWQNFNTRFSYIEDATFNQDATCVQRKLLKQETTSCGITLTQLHFEGGYVLTTISQQLGGLIS